MSRSVDQLRGSMSQSRVAEPASFERAHYVRTVGTFFPLSDPLAMQSAPSNSLRSQFTRRWTERRNPVSLQAGIDDR